jgi:hypothetical protein
VAVDVGVLVGATTTDVGVAVGCKRPNGLQAARNRTASTMPRESLNTIERLILPIPS